jgi:hypothetical protein
MLSHSHTLFRRDFCVDCLTLGANCSSDAYIADFGLARVLKGDTDTTNSNFGPVRVSDHSSPNG